MQLSFLLLASGEICGISWPDMPDSEPSRLPLLPIHRYEVLDTPREREFDQLVGLLSGLLEVPVALINFFEGERQWIKAEVGALFRSEFCLDVVRNSGELLVIPDTAEDPRYLDGNREMSEESVRFYAGAPLITPDGHMIGTLCVMDYQPRELGREHRDLLSALARQVVFILESRLRGRELAEQASDVGGHENTILKVAHDLRSPLSSIVIAGHLLGELADEEQSPKMRRLADLIQGASGDMEKLLTDMARKAAQ